MKKATSPNKAVALLWYTTGLLGDVGYIALYNKQGTSTADDQRSEPLESERPRGGKC